MGRVSSSSNHTTQEILLFMAIKAIVFDMEGVLMKTKDTDLYLSMAKALDAPYEIVRPIFFDDFNDHVDLGLADQIEFDKHVIATLGLGEEMVPVIQQVVDEQAFIDDVLLEKIKALRKDYKIGMLSNYSKIMREKIENEWKISHLFDAIIISCEVGLIKPDPAIYELILSQLGAKASEAVLIDDRIKNIEGAQQFGMHAIFYETREQALSDLDALLHSNQKK